MTTKQEKEAQRRIDQIIERDKLVMRRVNDKERWLTPEDADAFDNRHAKAGVVSDDCWTGF